MTSKIHLYLTPGSCSLAAHIALQETGLAFTTTNLKATRGYPTEYLHINPKGRVPILELDGELITETPAILSTISALAPEKKLLGSTVMEQARAQEWMAWLCSTLHGQAFACVFRPARFVGKDEGLYDVVKAEGRKCAKECFEFIEGKLEGKAYAVGDSFSLVDAYIYVFYRWGNMLKMGMRETYPNYTKLVDELVKRDGVRQIVEVEGISVLNE
jgi:glutathione S-transferase